MAPTNYNAEFEGRIATYRRSRRMLVAHNIHFRTTRSEFEAIVRARLRQPDSVTFFWPPSPEFRFRNSRTRHQGYVMLGFETRPSRQLADEDLRNFVVNGRPIRVSRQDRQAIAPEGMQTAAAPATTPSVPAPTARAPAPQVSAAPAPVVPAPTAAAPAAPASAAPTTTAPTAAIQYMDDDIDFELGIGGEGDLDSEAPEVEYLE